MEVIDLAFIKALTLKINQTSTIIQLQELFIKNKSHCYSPSIYMSFTERVNHFMMTTTDSFIKEQCEKLIDDLNEEKEFTNAIIPSKDPNIISLTLTFNTREESIVDDCFKELMKLIIQKTNGRKREACRILGITEIEYDKYMDSTKEVRAFARKHKRSIKSALAKDIRGYVD